MAGNWRSFLTATVADVGHGRDKAGMRNFVRMSFDFDTAFQNTTYISVARIANKSSLFKLMLTFLSFGGHRTTSIGKNFEVKRKYNNRGCDSYFEAKMKAKEEENCGIRGSLLIYPECRDKLANEELKPGGFACQ